MFTSEAGLTLNGLGQLFFRVARQHANAVLARCAGADDAERTVFGTREAHFWPFLHFSRNRRDVGRTPEPQNALPASREAVRRCC